MKKRVSLLLAIVFFISLLTFPTSAEEIANGTCGENLSWSLDSNGCLTITGSGDMYNYTWRNAPWYSYGNKIKSLSLPEGLTSIGNFAFMEMNSLTGKLVLPDNVKTIGFSAFCECNGFESPLKLPEKLESMGSYAFAYCYFTGELTIPENMVEEGISGSDLAYNSFSSYKSESTNYIVENGILYNKDKTTLISYPRGKSGELKITDTVTKIDSYAFAGCSAITGVLELPSELKIIDGHAFENCTGLFEGLIFPEKLTWIGDHSFTGCKRLVYAVVPESVTYLGRLAFANCSCLKDVYFKGDAPSKPASIMAATSTDNSFPADTTLHYIEGKQDWTPDKYCDYNTKTWTGTLNNCTVTYPEGDPVNVSFGSKITKPDDPSKDGSVFGGWYTDEQLTKAWNFDVDVVTENMTFYPKWIEATASFSTVTGTVKIEENTIEGAFVELLLGTEKIASTRTNSDGQFSFGNIECGKYNVTASHGGRTKTELVDVNTPSKAFNVQITLPTQSISSEVEQVVNENNTENTKSNADQILVGGIDEIVENLEDSVQKNQEVTISMSVEAQGQFNTETTEQVTSEQRSIIDKITLTASDGEPSDVEFFDLSLMKTTVVRKKDGDVVTEENLGDNNNVLLEIVIPFDFSETDSESIKIYRNHNSETVEMTRWEEKPSTDDPKYAEGGFIVDVEKGEITVFSKEFSTYGLTFEEKPNSDDLIALMNAILKSEEYSKKYDMNTDGEINILDAILLQSYLK